MPLDAPSAPEVPQLPADIATAVSRTFTYASADEGVHATARADGSLVRVDVQVYSDSEPERIAEDITIACAAALDAARTETVAALLASPLADAELRAALAGTAPGAASVGPDEGFEPFEATAGPVTAVVGRDGRLARLHVDDLSTPDDLGAQVVDAVNQALRQANGVVDDDLEQQADARLQQLEAALEAITASLEPVEKQLDEIERSLG